MSEAPQLPTNVRRLICLVLLLTLGATSLRGAGQPVAMTTEAIEEAIALGRQTAPRPYALGPWIGESDVIHSASIYTPFIRVALASQMAMRNGRTLSRSNIERELLEPIVYVAIRTLDAAGRQTMTGTVHLTGPAPRQRIDPLWVKPPGSVLRSLEPEADVRSVTFVAAFPLDAVKPGVEVALQLRPSRSSTVLFTPRGLITPTEFNKWR